MFPYRRLPGHITGLYIFTVANFLLLCHMTLVQADITVISLKTNQTVDPDIPDMPAYFGAHIIDDGIWGQVVYSQPANACLPIEPPPRSKLSSVPDLKWFVLIMRYGCDFSRKVLSAQEAGYDAAIVHNVGSNQLEPMGPNKDTIISIPSVFIGETDGLRIKDMYTYEKGFVLHMTPDFPMNLNEYLVPFAVGVGACFLVLIFVMVVKCIRDRRQRQRHCLPTRMLKSLPVKKFKKGDHDDICAICLEDYVEGEKLRVLPCSHTYHIKCIDPWLTESRRTCPVCKRKVLPRQPRNRQPDNAARSDSSSDEDGSDDGGATSPSFGRRQADENTPLLAAGNINAGGEDMPSTRGRINRGLLVPVEELDPQEMGTEAGAMTTTTPNPGRRYQSERPVASRTWTASRSLPSSIEDTSGGWYQSFATPPEGSPVSCAPLLLSRTTVPLAPAPAVNPGADLLSSGEHSLNGECDDFAPIEEWFVKPPSVVTMSPQRGARGPVEIAIDVGRQAEMSSPSTASSQDSQQPSTSSRTRRARGSRKRSSDQDMVV